MEEENSVSLLIKHWIVEYYCYFIWKQFDRTGRISSLEICDFILRGTENVFVSEVLESVSDDESTRRSRLLVEFMYKLVIGENLHDDRWESKQTLLEDVIDVFRMISRETSIHDRLDTAEISCLILLLKEQAVLACVRKNDFDLAKQVFERQWRHWKNEKELETKHKIAEILEQRNNTHSYLTLMPYDSLIDCSKLILHAVFGALKIPFLVFAGQNVFRQYSVLVNSDSGAEKLLGSSQKLYKKVTKENCSVTNGFTAPVVCTAEPVTYAGTSATAFTAPVVCSAEPVTDVGTKSTNASAFTTSVICTAEPVTYAKNLISPNMSFSRKSDNEVAKIMDCDKNLENNLQVKFNFKPISTPDSETCQPDKKFKPDCSESYREPVPLTSEKSNQPFGEQSSHKEKLDENRLDMSDWETELNDFLLPSKERKSKTSWLPKEEELIYLGVQKYGVGHWREIANSLKSNRTNVDVKDKWRTMTKQGKLKHFEKQFGPLTN